MAATRLIPLHINKGKSMAASIKDRLDYAQNPDKTDDGELISSYACDPVTAWQEFSLSRDQYLQNTGYKREYNVIAYQIRQSFMPGEISPEEANAVGYELAQRFTKGRHAFTVSTHIDRAHIHNHIVFNSVDLNAERKFRNFFLSSYAIRRLSDIICVEHGLSIIEERPRSEWVKRKVYPKRESHRSRLREELDAILAKKPKSPDALIKELQLLGYRVKVGKYISVQKEGMGKAIRLKSLGDGYTEEDILIRILKKRGKKSIEPTSGEFELIKDVEKILRERKGRGYAKWAEYFNDTQAAEVLIFIMENNIRSEKQLEELAKEASSKFHALSDEIKESERAMREISELRRAIIDYSKTRKVYEEYRKVGYSKKYLEAHREEITIHKAAKRKFDEMGDKRLPTVKELSAEFDKMLDKKKNAYKEYRTARIEMEKYTIAKANIHLLFGEKSVPERNAQPSREA